MRCSESRASPPLNQTNYAETGVQLKTAQVRGVRADSRENTQTQDGVRIELIRTYEMEKSFKTDGSNGMS